MSLSRFQLAQMLSSAQDGMRSLNARLAEQGAALNAQLAELDAWDESQFDEANYEVPSQDEIMSGFAACVADGRAVYSDGSAVDPTELDYDEIYFED